MLLFKVRWYEQQNPATCENQTSTTDIETEVNKFHILIIKKVSWFLTIYKNKNKTKIRELRLG